MVGGVAGAATTAAGEGVVSLTVACLTKA
jgi:hypothetical protein